MDKGNYCYYSAVTGKNFTVGFFSTTSTLAFPTITRIALVLLFKALLVPTAEDWCPPSAVFSCS